MDSTRIRLFVDYLYLSPYTFSVHTALLEKKIEFETHLVTFFQGKSDHARFNSLSPTGLIPLLVHNDFVMFDSLAMLEYLDEAFPDRPVLPKSIRDRARARMLLSHYRCSMKALRDERSTETVFYSERRATQPLTPEALEEVHELETILLSFLEPQSQFLFGNSWSIADAETSLMLQRLILNGDKLDSRLVNFANGNWKRDSVQAFVSRQRSNYRSYY